MSTIEGYLTRNYNITFLDARTITNEAKLSLQIDGYATPEQEPAILERAIEIYQNQPQEVQILLNGRKEQFNQTLTMSFNSGGSVSSSSSDNLRAWSSSRKLSSSSMAGDSIEEGNENLKTSSSLSSLKNWSFSSNRRETRRKKFGLM